MTSSVNILYSFSPSVSTTPGSIGDGTGVSVTVGSGLGLGTNVRVAVGSGLDAGAATENAHRSISELLTVAEAAGVRMALENLLAKDMPARPLETMQELRSFMANLPAEYVGICHDIGHTRLISLDIADEARIASDRLYALHLQDGSTDDDDHLPPGRGTLDFDSYARALEDIEFDGAWTLEVLTKNHPGSVEDVAMEIADIRDRWDSEGMRNIR